MSGITAEGENMSAGRLWMHRAGTGDASALGKVFEIHISAGIREVFQHQQSSLCLAFLENGSGSRSQSTNHGCPPGKGTQIRAAWTAMLFFWPSVCGKSIRNLPFTGIILLQLWGLSELCPLSRTCLGGIRSRKSWKLGKLLW